MPELLARLRVASRHAELISDERTLSIGALTIDAASHLATLAEEPLKLTPREFELLHLLARHAGRVVTHGAILERVWGTSDARRTDTLRVHVNQVRKKLAGTGDGTPQILTEPGIGYRLVQ
jgi:two-component system KDP operon response regulator KdpE